MPRLLTSHAWCFCGEAHISSHQTWLPDTAAGRGSAVWKAAGEPASELCRGPDVPEDRHRQVPMQWRCSVPQLVFTCMEPFDNPQLIPAHNNCLQPPSATAALQPFFMWIGFSFCWTCIGKEHTAINIMTSTPWSRTW